MTTEALKSLPITNLDASPIVANTVGEGAPGPIRSVEGFVVPLLLTVGSTYQLVRFPTNVKIKNVEIAADILDSSTAALVLDYNISHSDASDGTPSAIQGKVPTTATPPAETTWASYASPNIAFGSPTTLGTKYTVAFGWTSIMFAGTNFNFRKLIAKPLWSALGFTSDPGGFFDLTAYVSTGVTTATGTGYLLGRVSYVE